MARLLVLLLSAAPAIAMRSTLIKGRSSIESEEATLGLEGQDEIERMKCMRVKENRPIGLLQSHAGAKFPASLQVDSLNNTEKLKGAVCEEWPNGCGAFDAHHPSLKEDKACVREVPKLVHFVWLDHPLPEKYAKNIAAVMRINPDRDTLLWVNEQGKDVSALTNLLNDTQKHKLLVKSVEDHKSRFRNWDIIQKEPNVGARSDWIRLEAVNLYGGIYMDTDAQPRHSFSEYGGVFRWPFVAYSDPKGYGNLCNCVFGAEKQSALINLTIEGWRDVHLNHGVPSGPPFGCGVLTAAFMTYNQPEIMMLAQQYMFQRADGTDPVMSMTFDGSWMEKKDKK